MFESINVSLTVEDEASSSTQSNIDSFLNGNKPFHLHQGECIQFLRTLPDACIGATFTDPPYCSGGRTSSERTAKTTTEKYTVTGSGKNYEDFDGDNKDQRAFRLWCIDWMSECYRVSQSGAPIVVFTDWRQLPTVTDALQMAGFTWRGIAVWDKTGSCRPTYKRYAAQAEFMVWGSKGKMPNDRDAPTLPGVFRAPVRANDKFHVTGKNTEMTKEAIQIAERGSVVLDPFAGSGTTGAAAIELGYRPILCEWSEHYAGVARARCEEAVLLRNGGGQ